MRGLLYKFLLWIAKESEHQIAPSKNIDLPAGDEWKTWHGKRLETLERDVRMLMDHLGVYLDNRPKLVKRQGQTLGGNAAMQTTAPSEALG